MCPLLWQTRYGWDFVGVCASIYGYGCGFLFLQFRDEPVWIAFYGLIQTVIAGIPIGMTFSSKYFQTRWDDGDTHGKISCFNRVYTECNYIKTSNIPDIFIWYIMMIKLKNTHTYIRLYIHFLNEFCYLVSATDMMTPGQCGSVGSWRSTCFQLYIRSFYANVDYRISLYSTHCPLISL